MSEGPDRFVVVGSMIDRSLLEDYFPGSLCTSREHPCSIVQPYAIDKHWSPYPSTSPSLRGLSVMVLLLQDSTIEFYYHQAKVWVHHHQ